MNMAYRDRRWDVRGYLQRRRPLREFRISHTIYNVTVRIGYYWGRLSKEFPNEANCSLAQYYVDLMMKLGLVRFSMLLALALVVLAIVVQMAVTMVLHGQVESIDVIRSIFFGLLITPWAVYFLSVVVEQLEESRQRLSRLVQNWRRCASAI